MMRKILVPGGVHCILIATLLISGCASVVGPRDVSVPVGQLQASLARKLPQNQRYLELLDVSVNNPRVQLQPDTSRVVTTLDATIAPVFMQRKLTGTFTLSGILAIDATRHAVVLRQPRMEKLILDGVDTEVANQLARISDSLAQRLLGDVPLYTFDPMQFRYGGVQFYPSKISTTAQAIVVTFEPVK